MEFISSLIIATASFLGIGTMDTETATVESTRQEIIQVTEETSSTSSDIKTMIVAGGCFWCVEADLEKLPGVIEVVSGYAGGDTENPTYENYGSGGHREVVEVTYDPNQIDFEDILIVTLKTTDPTDDDGTFGDRGDKYSSAFYFENEEQRLIIEDLINEVDQYGPYEAPLAIDIEARPTFWPAEDYHQDYYKGTLSKLKYNLYRTASGRPAFIEEHWGEDYLNPDLPWRNDSTNNQSYMWNDYRKPNKEKLKTELDELAFKVTQEDGTERAGTSPLDKNWEEGIYVDILSGEPLFSSKDKFDSGTGWPSFTKPITPDAVTEKTDRKLFITRTEVRSTIAGNHLGHVFNDGPADSTGLRYCMNGVALKFIPKADMEEAGYADFIKYI
jgi:peptide methionine sulfoxide reductase msrA/msrB